MKRHQLFKTLLDLHTLLTKSKGPLGEIDILAYYKGIVEKSDKGSDCPYAMKCRRIFIENDIDEELLSILKELQIMANGKAADGGGRAQPQKSRGESSKTSTSVLTGGSHTTGVGSKKNVSPGKDLIGTLDKGKDNL